MKKRAMKKWIPTSIYCDECKWWKRVWYPVRPDMLEDYDVYIDPAHAKKELEKMIKKSYNHNRNECQFGKNCEEDCRTCDEMVSKCEYLNYIEYGQYPLGDSCKVCGIRDYEKEWRKHND